MFFFLKMFSAYNILIFQPSGNAGDENEAAIDPDGEIQLFSEVQSSATQIQVNKCYCSF